MAEEKDEEVPVDAAQAEETIREGNIVPKRTDEDLKKLVLDICDGHVFTDLHVSDPNLLGSVFMVLGLGAFAEWNKKELEQVGLIYEDIHKAAPRSINGMPMFFSMQILHKDDWERVRPALQKEQERRKVGVELGPPPTQGETNG